MDKQIESNFSEYYKINQKSWDNQVDIHLESEFYDMKGFLAGKTSLKEIELSLLGNISGKTILHLQCHFGQDSISLAKMGAKVTAVDISPKAIETAKELNIKMGTDVEFICSNIYDVETLLNNQFDMVFISYGTIIWLPDLDKWAKIISNYLKQNGELLFIDFHPVILMLDDDFQKINYSYFNREPIIETYTGTYANQSADLVQGYVTWNHSLSETFSCLKRNDLEIVEFLEFDYSPYNCFKNLVEISSGKFQVKGYENKFPMVMAIKCLKIKYV